MANVAAKYAATNRNSFVTLDFDDLRPHSVYAVAIHTQSYLRFVVPVVPASIVAPDYDEPAFPVLSHDLCRRPNPVDSHSFELSFAVNSMIYSCRKLWLIQYLMRFMVLT